MPLASIILSQGFNVIVPLRNACHRVQLLAVTFFEHIVYQFILSQAPFFPSADSFVRPFFEQIYFPEKKVFPGNRVSLRESLHATLRYAKHKQNPKMRRNSYDDLKSLVLSEFLTVVQSKVCIHYRTPKCPFK